MPGNDGRPRDPKAPKASRTGIDNSTLDRRHLEARANCALRCAWLTVHADLLYGVDEGGMLSAQLLDLRDLLETQDSEGRWSA